ncbi:hypothetical protein [Nostoc sp. FACHB-190]|uniref:hypothetical protein n=1 Tax=Nostoc sp. FACHB-190 TaxID=2692838 RepID=UPI0016888B5E|nr:hypothetical protein [Nostoc sp. FACHB-190]MBD2302749.1 hypothetical protein [Nostoc sp. FACHB-190]
MDSYNVLVQNKRRSPVFQTVRSLYQLFEITIMPQITTTQQLRSVKIDFYNYEIYDGQKLIARITYDHKDLTQPWVVEVNNQEVFRRAWWQKSFDDISWYYKKGSLPVQKEDKEQGAGSMGENLSPLRPARLPLLLQQGTR